MALATNISSYHRGEPNVGIGRALHKLEMSKLGLLQSELLYPINHVEANVRLGDGGPKVVFTSRLLDDVGPDDNGDPVPQVTNVLFFSQNWDAGGFSLDPEEQI